MHRGGGGKNKFKYEKKVPGGPSLLQQVDVFLKAVRGTLYVVHCTWYIVCGTLYVVHTAVQGCTSWVSHVHDNGCTTYVFEINLPLSIWDISLNVPRTSWVSHVHF